MLVYLVCEGAILTEISWGALPVACLIGLAGTWFARSVGHKFNWLHEPGPGRIHTRSVPRLGGPPLLVALVFSAVMSLRIEGPVLGLLLGAFVITGLTLIDDIQGLSPRNKLAGQCVAAVIPLAFGVRIEGVSNPFGGILIIPLLLAIPFTVMWIVALMNAVNLADGLDGLAAGIALVAVTILVILSARLGQPEVATLGLALVGAIIGFLPFNIFRASIFLGDSGAHLLGYMLATLAIVGGAKLATALLVLGVPILDVAWSVIRRWRSGVDITSRDTNHFHHRLLRTGMSQLEVVAVYCGVCATFGLSALILTRYQKLFAFGILFAVIIIVALCLARTDRRKPS